MGDTAWKVVRFLHVIHHVFLAARILQSLQTNASVDSTTETTQYGLSLVRWPETIPPYFDHAARSVPLLSFRRGPTFVVERVPKQRPSPHVRGVLLSCQVLEQQPHIISFQSKR